MRLDVRLTELYADISRAKAQDLIQEGLVLVNGKPAQKSSMQVQEEDQIERLEADITFASRAGFKLYDVLADFQIDLRNRICLDVGASTGGFTDVCLREGAKQVYAVDVGRDQLLARLKRDARVVNIEGVNCRYLDRSMFVNAITFACMDVSFISAKLILPAVFALMEKPEVVVLVKPQFEAGRAQIGKHGIVKNAKVQLQVLQDMVQFVNAQGLHVKHLQESSVTGRDGNREFVMHITTQPNPSVLDYRSIVKHQKDKR